MENLRENTNEYNPGDVIIKFEPQVYCVSDGYKSEVCDYCLKKSDHLKKCSKCTQMFYCDKECQTNDWKKHKFECKVFRNPMWLINPLDSLFRLDLRWWLCFDSDPKFSSEKYLTFRGKQICFNDLAEDSHKLKGDVFKMGQVIALTHTFQAYGLKINRDKFLHWFAVKDKCVIFDIMDIDQIVRKTVTNLSEKMIGLAIIYEMTKENHSCIPNASKQLKGRVMEIRAIKAIPIGEDITLSFIGLEQDKLGRQTEMKIKEIPLCRCLKCRLNLDKDFDYEEYKELYAFHLRHWITLDNRTMRSFGVNTDYAIDWQFILYMKSIFGEYHPSITRALVISFVYFAENSRFASKTSLKLWFQRIEPMARITHGSDHPYYINFKKFASNYISV